MTPPISASLAYLICAHSKMDIHFHCPASLHSHFKIAGGACLTLDLGVASSSPTLGIEIALEKKKEFGID